MSETLKLNAHDLEQELHWLSQVIDTRFKLYFGQESPVSSVFDFPPPDLSESGSPYAQFLLHHQASVAERLMLVMALVPHIRPRQLDIFFTRNPTYDRSFTEFGGIQNPSGEFIPTGETILFLLDDGTLEMRFQLSELFGPEHFFAKHRIFHFQTNDGLVPAWKGPLRLRPEHIRRFTTGIPPAIHERARFSAFPVQTTLEWSDLVLDSETLAKIQAIEAWLLHGNTLMKDWGMDKRLRPGYRAFFYGASGTGKTLAASLLGKSSGRELYRIDLSTIISKYIGETEKNLVRVFDQAKPENQILFFDEADALFGKRSQDNDTTSRYANQEVSYLLQRMERYEGLSILSASLKPNIDDAFLRRFQSVVHLPMPGPAERLRIWQSSLPPKAALAKDVDLRQIAEEYELSGGAIMSVIRSAALEALRRGGNSIITNADLLSGIRRELQRVGR
jgi:AAA+ superfamily predicted ATPase